MSSIKNILFPVVFFCMVIIASCITFSNGNEIFASLKYDKELVAENIDLFDGFKAYAATSNLKNNDQLLLMFYKDSLKYIFTNGHHSGRFEYYCHTRKSGVFVMNKKPRSLYDRGRGRVEIKDSIFSYKNMILKIGTRESNGRWNDGQFNIKKLFVKKDNTITEYDLTENLNNGTGGEQALLDFVSNGIPNNLPQTAATTITANCCNDFFKYKIMEIYRLNASNKKK